MRKINLAIEAFKDEFCMKNREFTVYCSAVEEIWAGFCHYFRLFVFENVFICRNEIDSHFHLATVRPIGFHSDGNLIDL